MKVFSTLLQVARSIFGGSGGDADLSLKKEDRRAFYVIGGAIALGLFAIALGLFVKAC